MRDPLAPFAADRVAAVAAETGVDEARLRSRLRAHQEQARDLPGVDDLVYEWRRAGLSPVVERRDDAYLLRVEPSAWAEFAAALGFESEEAAAVKAVHERHVPGTEADGAAMVLTRP